MITIHSPSQNYSKRNPLATVSMVVLHNTAGGLSGSLQTLCDPKRKVSAHYLVSRDGTVYSLVDEAMAAWHAGNREANQRSIGIEIVAGDKEPGMTGPQEVSLVGLVSDICKRYSIQLKSIVPHRQVTATACPGFVWATDKDLEDWKRAKLNLES